MIFWFAKSNKQKKTYIEKARKVKLSRIIKLMQIYYSEVQNDLLIFDNLAKLFKLWMATTKVTATL